MRFPRAFLFATSASLLSACFTVACGVDEVTSAPPADAGVDRRAAVPTLGPPPSVKVEQTIDASCAVVATQEVLVAGSHVPEDSVIAYASNPPSSGPHYPRWANFQEFEQPVPDGYLVHALEHGAVALLYNCASRAECAETAAALWAIRDGLAIDPLCDPFIRVRVILAPRPELDVPIAAAAWGFTYKAACLDPTSLTAFVREHYAHGPEDFCSPGATTF